ncbi:hypothetical protein FQA39_LY19434 [Lamprigera yunnana]|nr:hypothetical protein FQA39_LY19434 [Lamprigera yunnana]
MAYADPRDMAPELPRPAGRKSCVVDEGAPEVFAVSRSNARLAPHYVVAPIIEAADGARAGRRRPEGRFDQVEREALGRHLPRQARPWPSASSASPNWPPRSPPLVVPSARAAEKAARLGQGRSARACVSEFPAIARHYGWLLPPVWLACRMPPPIANPDHTTARPVTGVPTAPLDVRYRSG